MRDIKILCWNPHEKKMYDPMPIVDFAIIKINGHILRFWTGLKDKNGKEIYEGDIIDYGRGRHYPITYEVNGFGIKFVHGHERNWLDLTKFEVIGNIFQNPELLNQ